MLFRWLKREGWIDQNICEPIRLPGESPEEGPPDPEVEADEMYQNAGKKAIRTALQMILRAGGPTSSAGEETTRTTVLRSSAWSEDRPDG